MKLGFFDCGGELRPLSGRLRSLQLSNEGGKSVKNFHLPTGFRSAPLRIHNENPPLLSCDGDHCVIDTAHVVVINRYVVIAKEENMGNTQDLFIGFSFRLPHRKDIPKKMRPVEVYQNNTVFQRGRIYADSGQSLDYDDGRFFTLSGYFLMKDGESARVIMNRPSFGNGMWRLTNVGGGFSSHWFDELQVATAV